MVVRFIIKVRDNVDFVLNTGVGIAVLVRRVALSLDLQRRLFVNHEVVA